MFYSNENNKSYCRKANKKCRKYRIIISSLIFGVVLFLIGILLCFGKPQWNRWIYITQAYVLYKGVPFYDDRTGGYIGRVIDPPQNFSGRWYTWYPNGKLMGITCYGRAKCNGIDLFYSRKGVLQFSLIYNNKGQPKLTHSQKIVIYKLTKQQPPWIRNVQDFMQNEVGTDKNKIKHPVPIHPLHHSQNNTNTQNDRKKASAPDKPQDE